MHFENQKILPAVRKIKDFEEIIKTDYTYIALLDVHLAQLHLLIQMAKVHKKKILLHADMIKGLKHDEFAAQFLCQVIKPAGIISTHPSVISVAKKHNLLAISRLFLLDSQALETAYRMLKNCMPDYIEILPGVVPHLIGEIKEKTGLPIITGGLIRTLEDIENSLNAGAAAVSTSYSFLLKNNL